MPGLQLVLGTASQPDACDTIVMANLGYLQLKARPGLWNLRLREGPSADIYSVARLASLTSETAATDQSIWSVNYIM